MQVASCMGCRERGSKEGHTQPPASEGQRGEWLHFPHVSTYCVSKSVSSEDTRVPVVLEDYF